MLGYGRLCKTDLVHQIIADTTFLFAYIFKNCNSRRMGQNLGHLSQLVLLNGENMCFAYSQWVNYILQYYDNIPNKKSQIEFWLVFLEPRFFSNLVGIVKFLVRFGEVDYTFYQSNKTGNP